MEIKFEIGDLVVLKSGGPLMVVTDGVNEKDLVSCMWFENSNFSYGEVKYNSFHFKTLKSNQS
jgi:uncharacterized protein YodC (DUF2158 family)